MTLSVASLPRFSPSNPRFSSLKQEKQVSLADLSMFQRQLMQDGDIVRRRLTQKLGQVWVESRPAENGRAGYYTIRTQSRAPQALLDIRFNPQGGWFAPAAYQAVLQTTLAPEECDVVLKHFQS